MKHGTGKWLAGAAAGAACLGALYGASARYFMKLALEREGPKARKQEYTGEMAQIVEAVASGARKLKESGCEEIRITASHDGIPLVGHWHDCPNPRRVIVAMHGWRTSWAQDFGIVADFWFQNDCCVLFAEQRGQGNSGGRHMSFGMLEQYDCRDWARWAVERTGGALPVYLSGVSMGAATVMLAAGLELPEQVRGISADCGFTSPHAIWAHVAQTGFHLPYALYRPAAEAYCRRNLGVSAAECSTVEALKKASVPVLFIHGQRDDFVPPEMTAENYRACRSEKYLLLVPDAGHGVSYLKDREGCQQSILAFWEKYDTPQKENIQEKAPELPGQPRNEEVEFG